MAQAEEMTVVIFVSLDKTANPAVQLEAPGKPEPRSIWADPDSTIRWQKKDNNDSFEITRLDPTGSDEAFAPASTGENGQWLRSVYQPDGPGNHEYILTVTSGQDTYDTTKRDPSPDDDLPVIRN